MRRLGATVLSAAFLFAAPVLMAQADLKGKDAPDFKVGSTINEAQALSLDECRGDVVLIKYWGVN
ncbi:MAG: hypothetical protein L0Z55_01075 [Planctomycetes bacterium]|nr:hypothetical protein [Planctomycetota bacterium]